MTTIAKRHGAAITGSMLVLGVAAYSFFAASQSAQATALNTQDQSQAKRVIVPAGGRSGGMLSPGIMVGNTLYLSGQLGTSGRADGVGGETKVAIESAQKILKAAEMDLADVVSVTAYLVDPADYQPFNAAYTALFTTEPRPVRTTVFVKELVNSAKVELTFIAVKAR